MCERVTSFDGGLFGLEVVCFCSRHSSSAFGLRAVPSPIFDPSDLSMGDHS